MFITPVLANTPIHDTIAPQILIAASFIAIFYFLILRPHKKRQQEHEFLLQSLKVGDKVYINGGIMGEITRLSKEIAHIKSGSAHFIMRKEAVEAIIPKNSFNLE